MQTDLCGALESAVAAYAFANHAASRSAAPVAHVVVVPAWEGRGTTGLWAIDHVPSGERIALFLDRDDAGLVAERLSPDVFGTDLSLAVAVREDLADACVDAGLGFRRIRVGVPATQIGVYVRSSVGAAHVSR